MGNEAGSRHSRPIEQAKKSGDRCVIDRARIGKRRGGHVGGIAGTMDMVVGRWSLVVGRWSLVVAALDII